MLTLPRQLLYIEMAETSTTDTYPESVSESSESESASTSMSPPRPIKSRKLSGAATYKSKFNSAWIKEYPFITSVPGDPYRYINFISLLCKTLRE